MLSNYTELKASVADWLNRTDLASAVSDFIALAEVKLERKLLKMEHRALIKRAEAQIDTEYSAVPGDFLAARSLVIETTPPSRLEFVTTDYIDLQRERYRTAGVPRYFGIVGNQIRVEPTPATGGYQGELTYFSKLPRLSNTVTTNWLLTQHPDAYLYGALIQAAPYLKDDERIATWAGLFNAAVEEIDAENQRQLTSGGPLKMRARTIG